MNVSFAWTSDAFSDEAKSETRRFWVDSYAAKFKKGSVHTAIRKQRQPGGVEPLGLFVVLEAPYRERLGDMSDASFLAEGGTRYWASKAAYVEMMGGEEARPWVLKFKKMAG